MHAEPATHEEPAKDAHAVPAEAEHAAADAGKAPAQGHAQTEQAPESWGGFGFFSFIAFVLLLIGAVVVLDKTILNPDHD